jgi:hypothetical protein
MRLVSTVSIAAVVVAVVATGSARAQGQLNRKQEREVLEILASVGGTCEQISRTQAVGTLPSKDTLMAVACAGGEQYVILVDTRARMQYYATCAALAEANKNQVRCFN